MLIKMLRKDFQRSKAITVALFVFIMLAALLVASASSTIMGLFSSMEHLFAAAKVPHFVQMHAGDIDQSEIDAFAARTSLVSEQQTVKMVNVNGANIFLGESGVSEENSVMDISFVQQNQSFDLLLNLESEVLRVADGEVAVPIYYMQERGLQLGDKVSVTNGQFSMEFTVTDFVRDAQMNPSLVSSKRFVVSASSMEILKAHFSETEYLIEFLLTDAGAIGEFSTAYQESSMPQNGPAVTYELFRTMTALSEGLVVAVIIVVSLLLITIAMLCLRFTILATIEEDYKQIGIMKAIGINGQDIRRVYLTKYIVLAVAASVTGYVASLFLSRLFSAKMTLYMGVGEKTLMHYLVPLLATSAVILLIVLFCQLVLRRFRRISAVQALRSGSMGETRLGKRSLALNRNSFTNINIMLAIKDVFGRFRVYAMLCLVFVICSFVIIVPVNLLTTSQSPDFTNYMGTGRSDIRIDVQRSDEVVERFARVIEYIENDQDVARFSPLVTCKFKVKDADGAYENINVEIGDFSIFPLKYLSGSAPVSESQIALSSLNSDQLGKGVGDTIELLVNGQERLLQVSGVYQDVTNGGKTAKALLPYQSDDVLWYIVSLDVKSGVDIASKVDEYSAAFYPVKVTYIEDYLRQTLGATIQQLKLIVSMSLVIAMTVSVLITSLFMRMLIAKDTAQIAIMKSIGFSLRDIRVQYVTRALAILAVGIIVGTIASNTLGQGLASAMMSFMGASRIEFVVNPVVAYVLCPLDLMVVVTITTLSSTVHMRKSSIAEMIVE